MISTLIFIVSVITMYCLSTRLGEYGLTILLNPNHESVIPGMMRWLSRPFPEDSISSILNNILVRILGIIFILIAMTIFVLTALLSMGWIISVIHEAYIMFLVPED